MVPLTASIVCLTPDHERYLHTYVLPCRTWFEMNTHLLNTLCRVARLEAGEFIHDENLHIQECLEERGSADGFHCLFDS